MGVLNKDYKTLKLKYGEYYSLKITDSSKNIINNIEITGSQISTTQQVFSEATYSNITSENRDRIKELMRGESRLEELSKKQEIPSIEAVLITYIRSKSLNYLKHIQAQENVFQTLLDKGQRELEIRISTLEACDPKEILSEELRAKVHALLESMPEKTRTAFIRDRLDGKSHKEIAEELGISVKGVEYHIGRAVKILRDNLKDYAPFLFFFI